MPTFKTNRARQRWWNRSQQRRLLLTGGAGGSQEQTVIHVTDTGGIEVNTNVEGATFSILNEFTTSGAYKYDGASITSQGNGSTNGTIWGRVRATTGDPFDLTGGGTLEFYSRTSAQRSGMLILQDDADTTKHLSVGTWDWSSPSAIYVEYGDMDGPGANNGSGRYDSSGHNPNGAWFYHVYQINPDWTLDVWVDGVLQTSTGGGPATAEPVLDFTEIRTGFYVPTFQNLAGEIDEIRVTKGALYDQAAPTIPVPSARWPNPDGTPGPVPEDVPILMHFDDSGDADKNDGQSTISTNSAVSWNASNALFGAGRISIGANEYLSMKDMPQIGTQDFKIEFWVRMGDIALDRIFLDTRDTNLDGDGFALYLPGGTTALRFYTGGNDQITSTTGLTDVSWHAVALSRVSGTTRLFIDGVQEGGNYADAANYQWAATHGMVLGAPSTGSLPAGGGEASSGFDEFRLIIGEGISANYTPSGPFPNP